ncbi:hypothetical protein Q8A67_009572 [Cirrhinus molitorella]|uniref:Uncharacterized protein n=1 Tax=Cirrhinus molitorella TaxID=172907 RepID=A0AA88PWF3_9TELE|nr:hypothetical protein Q8A67_009572 [Cirrhinus molitorella]
MSYSEPCGEKDQDTEEPRDLVEEENNKLIDEEHCYYQNSSDVSPAEEAFSWSQSDEHHQQLCVSTPQ